MRAVFLATCLLLAPALALAERAVVLPPRSEQPLPADHRAQLVAALGAALTASGVETERVIAEESCPQACVSGALAAAGVHHAVELTVWRAPDGAVSGVSVSILMPAGQRFSEGAQVGSPTELQAAVSRATAGAYGRLRRGPGPWLQLDGTPEGAAITVDGQAAGALPRLVRVSGGLHRVIVSHPGYEPLDETITVPRNPDALKRVELALHASVEPQPSIATVERRSPWNYAIAGVAALTGALLSIGPVQSAVQDGECGRKELGACTGVVAFELAQGVQLATAGLLFSAGVTFALWAPLTVQADARALRVATTSHF